MPYWAICLLALSIVVISVVMGTVVGLVVAKHDASPSQGDQQLDSASISSPSDVTPLEVLTPDLPPLATGRFSLPPLDTTQASKSCFRDPVHAQAWSCDMPPSRLYSFHVGRVDGTPNMANYDLTLTPSNASSAKFIWGTQPPEISDAQRLTLVRDIFEEGRGSAWWLNLTYDKTVLVHEDKFPGKNNSKRDKFGVPLYEVSASGSGRHIFRKNVVAKEGDRPWICKWRTKFEVFIYPLQNVSNPGPSPSRLLAASESAPVDSTSPTDGMRDGPPNPPIPRRSSSFSGVLTTIRAGQPAAAKS